MSYSKWFPGFSGAKPDRQLLVAALILYCIQAALYITWFVDDAAISFTFARNLGAGWGLVLYPGGERVEAYSNPLWVFFLAPFSALGFNLFATAKLFSLLFGLSALALLTQLGQRIVGAFESLPRSVEGAEKVSAGSGHGPIAADGTFPLGGLAALLTGVHPPFVAWTTGGLEGGLYCFLLIWAADRFLAEQLEPDAFVMPWSGVLFFLASITRPEGILFFVAAFVIRGLWGWLDRREVPLAGTWRSWAVWCGFFLLPWLLYQFWHYDYFASLVTNTYYVKTPETSLGSRFLSLNSRGMRYVTNWFTYYRITYFLPLLVLPLLEHRGRPSRGRGWQLIIVFLLASLFFPLQSDGDWMREFRFMAPVAPFCYLLVAGALAALGRILPRRWQKNTEVAQLSSWKVALCVVVYVLVSPAVWAALKFQESPETSVADVKARADFFREAKEQLGLEDDVIFMDPDLGATSFYSEMHVADTWGLANVPFAVHRYEQPFVADYVFRELKPHFAHVFGYWNSRVKILDDPRWNAGFIKLPSYRNLKGGSDGGNWVSRRLIEATRGEYPLDAKPIRSFESGLELVHASLDVEALAPGSKTRLTLFWRTTRKQTSDALFLTRLENSEGESINLDHLPIYGWHQVSAWREREVLKESLLVEVPRSQAQGMYRLQVRVVNPRSGVEDPPLRLVSGYRPGPVLAVGDESARREVGELSEKARVLLKAGRFEDAAKAARRAQSIAADDLEIAGVLAKCEHAWRDDVLALVGRLMEKSARRASEKYRMAYWRWLDDEEVKAFGRQLGRTAMDRAKQLEERSDFAGAFENYLAAVTLDPRLSMARRRAEKLRLRRDVPRLAPSVSEDPSWIRTLVVGEGEGGTLSKARDHFKPGETIICQVYWAAGAPQHSTRWAWFDSRGVKRFEQLQSTAANTRLSFAFVEALIPPGEWTVEVRVNGKAVGAKRFQVTRQGGSR